MKIKFGFVIAGFAVNNTDSVVARLAAMRDSVSPETTMYVQLVVVLDVAVEDDESRRIAVEDEDTVVVVVGGVTVPELAICKSTQL
jgi:hypothetical protein